MKPLYDRNNKIRYFQQTIITSITFFVFQRARFACVAHAEDHIIQAARMRIAFHELQNLE